MLADRGTYPDEEDFFGRIPLYMAVFDNNIRITTFLDLGANVDIVDIHDNTALYIAITKNNIDMVALLVSVGADVNVKNWRVFT